MSSDLDEIRRFMEDRLAEHERTRGKKPRTLSFNDFDQACKALELDGGIDPSTIGHIPDPERKASDNHLTPRVIELLKDDMKYFSEVEDYINSRAIEDESFPEKIRDCFRATYNKLSGSEVNPLFGDDLYFGILHELTGGSRRNYYGQIRVLLTHYFAKCEVFPWHPGEEEPT